MQAVRGLTWRQCWNPFLLWREKLFSKRREALELGTAVNSVDQDFGAVSPHSLLQATCLKTDLTHFSLSHSSSSFLLGAMWLGAKLGQRLQDKCSLCLIPPICVWFSFECEQSSCLYTPWFFFISQPLPKNPKITTTIKTKNFSNHNKGSKTKEQEKKGGFVLK